MDYNRFSKKDLVDMLDIIQSSVKASSEEDLTKTATRLKDMICADSAVCGLGSVSSGRLVNILKIVNLNYPGEWLSTYAAEGLYKDDPVIRYNFEFYKPHLWSEAIRAFPERPYTELMNKASEFGLKFGVAGGVNGRGYNRGSIFSFSSRNNVFNDRQKDIISVVTPHVHQALVRVCDGSSGPRCQLSGREKEILRWIREGKTNWEISMIINISERTVKFHVQNIERKLNAVNKTHAVAIAMESGLIS